METTLVIVFGSPGSGKSSFCRCLHEQLVRCPNGSSEAPPTVEYLEFDRYDDQRSTTSGNSIRGYSNDEESLRLYDMVAWKRGRACALLELHTVLQDAVRRKRIVVIDDTLHLRSMRKEIYRIGSSYGTQLIHFIFMDAPVEVCVSRNRHRQEERRRTDLMDCLQPESPKGQRERQGASHPSDEPHGADSLAHYPTDRVIETHCTTLQLDCVRWRPPRGSDAPDHPLHFVPLDCRYKWERNPTCVCWQLNAIAMCPMDLAELVVDQLFVIRCQEEFSDPRNPLRVQPTRTSSSSSSSLSSASTGMADGRLELRTNGSRLDVLDQQLRQHLHSVIVQSPRPPPIGTIREWNAKRVALMREFRSFAKGSTDEWEVQQTAALQNFRIYLQQSIW